MGGFFLVDAWQFYRAKIIWTDLPCCLYHVKVVFGWCAFTPSIGKVIMYTAVKHCHKIHKVWYPHTYS